ncbi:unnamed protein product [Closterium sp. NIES-65]|nr:unnamed protein product [Closterium sp. NIES-65]
MSPSKLVPTQSPADLGTTTMAPSASVQTTFTKAAYVGDVSALALLPWPSLTSLRYKSRRTQPGAAASHEESCAQRGGEEKEEAGQAAAHEERADRHSEQCADAHKRAGAHKCAGADKCADVHAFDHHASALVLAVRCSPPSIFLLQTLPLPLCPLLPLHHSRSPPPPPAMGPTLRCYHLPSGRLLAAVDVFDGVRIHGIVPRGSRGVGGAVWTREGEGEGEGEGRGEAAATVVVVHGERRVKLVVLTVQQAAQVAATVTVQQQQQGVGERRETAEQGGVGQGVGGGVKQGGEGGQGGGVRMAVGACVVCRDHWAGVLAVGLSDNSVELWATAAVGSDRTCGQDGTADFSLRLLRSVACSDRSLLYAMRLHWHAPSSCLHVAAGTIFNQCAPLHLPYRLPSPHYLPHLPAAAALDCAPPRLCLLRHSGRARVWRVTMPAKAPHTPQAGGCEEQSCCGGEGTRTVECGAAHRELFGHGARLWDAHLDSQVAVTVSEDCTARVWCIQDGRLLALIPAHQGRGIWRCVVHPPTRTLITGGADAAINLHALPALPSPLPSPLPAPRALPSTVRPALSWHPPLDALRLRVTPTGALTGHSIAVTSAAAAAGAVTEGEAGVDGDTGRKDRHVFTTDPAGGVVWWHLDDTAPPPAPSTCPLSLDTVQLSGRQLPATAVARIQSPRGARVVCVDACPHSKLLALGDQRGHLYLYRFSLAAPAASRPVADCHVAAVLKGAHGISAVASVAIEGAAGMGAAAASLGFTALIHTTGRDGCICTFALRAPPPPPPLAPSSGPPPGPASTAAAGAGAVGHTGTGRACLPGSEGAVADTAMVCAPGTEGGHAGVQQGGGQQGGVVCVGVQRAGEVGMVERVVRVRGGGAGRREGRVAVGFAAADFVVWSVDEQAEVARIACGGWRRPHSFLIDTNSMGSFAFAFLKGNHVHVHRTTAAAAAHAALPSPHTPPPTPPSSLHPTFHGREMHSLALLPLPHRPSPRTRTPSSSCPSPPCASLLLSAAEDGCLRASLYDASGEGSGGVLEGSERVGEHVGGSAIRAITTCAAEGSSTCYGGAGGDGAPSSWLVFTAGAREVLMCWLLLCPDPPPLPAAPCHGPARPSTCAGQQGGQGEVQTEGEQQRVGREEVGSRGEGWEIVFLKGMQGVGGAAETRGGDGGMDEQQVLSFWLSTHRPSKRKVVQCGSSSSGGGGVEDDVRYLSATAFSLGSFSQRSLVAVVAAATSDAQLHLLAFHAPSLSWHRLASLHHHSCPVLSLHHLLLPSPHAHTTTSPSRAAPTTAPTAAPSLRALPRCLITSGATDGAVVLWDVTAPVTHFLHATWHAASHPPPLFPSSLSIAPASASSVAAGGGSSGAVRPVSGRGSEGGQRRRNARWHLQGRGKGHRQGGGQKQGQGGERSGGSEVGEQKWLEEERQMGVQKAGGEEAEREGEGRSNVDSQQKAVGTVGGRGDQGGAGEGEERGEGKERGGREEGSEGKGGEEGQRGSAEAQGWAGVEVGPLCVVRGAHQSGVNCIAAAATATAGRGHWQGQETRADGGDGGNGGNGGDGVDGVEDGGVRGVGAAQVVVVSGGDDEAVHAVVLHLDGMGAEHSVHTARSEGLGAEEGGREGRGMVARVVAQTCEPNAHSAAVKGIWTDGQAVLSVGLDQRLRCWSLPSNHHAPRGEAGGAEAAAEGRCSEEERRGERGCAGEEGGEAGEGSRLDAGEVACGAEEAGAPVDGMREGGMRLEGKGRCVVDVPEAEGLAVMGQGEGRYLAAVCGRGMQLIHCTESAP